MDNIKIKRWICDILLFLCFTAIAFFAGKILINQWKYKKAQKKYDTLQKAVQTEKSINWKKLKRMNKDILYKSNFVNEYEKSVYESCLSKTGISKLMKSIQEQKRNAVIVNA